MITVKLDGDTYIRWLQDLGDLWFEKGPQPPVVRKPGSGVWQVLRPNPAA